MRKIEINELSLEIFILRKNIHVKAGDNKTEEAVVLTEKQLKQALTTAYEAGRKDEQDEILEKLMRREEQCWSNDTRRNKEMSTGLAEAQTLIKVELTPIKLI